MALGKRGTACQEFAVCNTILLTETRSDQLCAKAVALSCARNSKHHSPSGQANGSSVCYEIARAVQSPKVHYRANHSPSLVPILSQTDLVHALSLCFLLPLLCFSKTSYEILTFRHRASSVQDRRFATLQRTLFIYLINKHISLSDICLSVYH